MLTQRCQNLELKSIFKKKSLDWLLHSASFQSHVGAETFLWKSMTSASERFLRSVNIPSFHAASPPSCFLFPVCVLTADQSVITLCSLLHAPVSRTSLSLERGHGSVGLNRHYCLSDGQKRRPWTQWTAALRVWSMFDLIRPANIFMLHLTAPFVFMIWDDAVLFFRMESDVFYHWCGGKKFSSLIS